MREITEENTTTIIKKQKFCLMMVILLIPFIHFSVDLPLAGGVPALLFLMLGYLFFTYEIFVQGSRFSKIEKTGFVFLAVVLGWNVITGLIGVLNYPYFSWINLNQMDHFRNFYDNITSIINLNELTAIKSWLSYKEIRYALIDVGSTYLISVWIYHLYQNEWEQAFCDLRKILLVLIACLVLYSLFEINFLLGGALGTNVLETINPLYMKIANTNGWWPPLLWQGQLRSLFAEPSFLGIFCAMAIPICFSFYFDKNLQAKSYLGMVLYFALALMVILSKARTGTLVFLGEVFLLSCWQIGLYQKQWKRYCGVMASTCLSFFIGLSLITQFPSHQSFDGQEVTLGSYMEQNVTSVVGDQRSNSARKANVRATTQVGLEHPLFGIGHSFKPMYVDKALTVDEKDIPEVHNWSKDMYEKGLLKSGYSALNQLSEVLVKRGIIGVLLFLFPIFLLVGKLFKKKWLWQKPDVICMGIALAGSCAAFASNIAMIPYYLVVGYLLVIVFSDGRPNNE